MRMILLFWKVTNTLVHLLTGRPKFHLYQPNIALLSGIAWDHINVFPTWDLYVEQFKIFIDSIVKGGERHL